MTRMQPDRDLVVFAYAYAASERDAVARVISELASELTGRGRNVRVIGIRHDDIVAAGGTAVEKLRRMRSEFAFLLRAAGVVLRNRGRLQAFVSVDVPSGLPLIGALARLLSRGQTRDVAWVMDLYRLAGGSGGVMNRARASIELLALKRSGRVVTIGACMAGRIQSVVGRSAEVAPLWHRQLERQERVRSEARPMRLLYSGSARELHPLQALLTAVAARTDVELLISGSGVEVERARSTLSRRPAANISIGGFIPDDALPRAYSDADLHVVSLAEPMTGTCVPSKVYAAMAAGRGVLHLGSPSAQSALDVQHANAGVIVATDDVAGIGRALDALVADERSTVNLGANALQFFERFRTVAAGADRWERILYHVGPVDEAKI